MWQWGSCQGSSCWPPCPRPSTQPQPLGSLPRPPPSAMPRWPPGWCSLPRWSSLFPCWAEKCTFHYSPSCRAAYRPHDPCGGHKRPGCGATREPSAHRRTQTASHSRQQQPRLCWSWRGVGLKHAAMSTWPSPVATHWSPPSAPSGEPRPHSSLSFAWTSSI